MADNTTQGLLQQLAGTYSAGQANLPSSINNGNPNTVYNVSPNQGGYLPPVSNAFDQWRINPAVPQGNALPAPQGGIDWQSLANLGGGNPMGGNGGLGGFKFPTPTGPTGTYVPPPASTPGGSPLPPIVNTGGNDPSIPVVPNSPGQFGHGGAYDTPTGGNPVGAGKANNDFFALTNGGFSNTPTPDHQQLSTSAHDQAGWGGLNMSSVSDFLGNSVPLGSTGQSLHDTALGRALGVRADGSVALGQIMDYFIPGNVYMGQTGKLNLLNALPGLATNFLGPLAGLAVNTTLDYLGSKYVNRDDSSLNFLEKVLKDRVVKNRENKAAGLAQSGGGEGAQGQTGHTGGAGNMTGGGNPFGMGNNGWVYQDGPNAGMPVSQADVDRSTFLDGKMRWVSGNSGSGGSSGNSGGSSSASSGGGGSGGSFGSSDPRSRMTSRYQ